MDFKLVKQNFVEVFSNYKYSLFSFIVFVIIYSLFNYFTNDELIFGNLGIYYLIAELVLMFFFALLFAIFISITIYKINYFRKFDSKSGAIGAGGTLLGVIVAGCPACSVTLASYIGLASFFSFFPLFGLELKIIAIPMLLYAIYSTLRGLTTCKIKSKKK